jgi:hypothetical protein
MEFYGRICCISTYFIVVRKHERLPKSPKNDGLGHVTPDDVFV